MTVGDTKKLKSIEFSEAIKRLKRLVDEQIITDEAAIILAQHQDELISLNTLRNTIIHRGKRILHYCELDEYFSQFILPVMIELFNCKYYEGYLWRIEESGSYECICNIVNEGKKQPVNYSKIACEKEKVRCKLKMIEKGRKTTEANNNVTNIIISQQFLSRNHSDETGQLLENKKCPCCGNNFMFSRKMVVDFTFDDIKDEHEIPDEFEAELVPVFSEYVEL